MKNHKEDIFKLSIVGTKGITGVYGGFETMARYFAKYASELNYECHVFGYFIGASDSLENVVEHQVLLRNYLFSFKNFFYDIESYRMASKFSSGIIVCGIGAAPFLLPLHKVKTIINTDGIEWRRKSYHRIFRSIIRLIEKLTVRLPFNLVSDSQFIQAYYLREHGKKTTYIPYGMDEFDGYDPLSVIKYNLTIYEYFSVCVRISPENNVLMIVKGFLRANIPKKIKLAILGKLLPNDPYHIEISEYIRRHDDHHQVNIIDLTNTDHDFNAIRGNGIAYIHGHSCGGTSPALVEAIGLKQFIIGYDWAATKELLDDNMELFHDEISLAGAIERVLSTNINNIKNMGIRLFEEKHEQYSWKNIIRQYIEMLKAVQV